MGVRMPFSGRSIVERGPETVVGPGCANPQHSPPDRAVVGPVGQAICRSLYDARSEKAFASSSNTKGLDC